MKHFQMFNHKTKCSDCSWDGERNKQKLCVISITFSPGIGFMTCISLDRYLAMVHPHRLQCLRSVKVVRRVCCLVWALVFLEVAPLLFRSMLHEHQGRRTCMEYFDFEGSRFTPYLLILACVVSFCCPLTIIMCCYAKINIKLRDAAKKNSVTGRSRRNHRANTIILLILLTFIVCFSPYHINVIQFMARKIHHQPTCEELRAFKVSLQVRTAVFCFVFSIDFKMSPSFLFLFFLFIIYPYLLDYRFVNELQLLLGSSHLLFCH